MVASPMDQFVTLSSALTGIASDKLAPGIDPIDIKQTYFDTAQKAEPAVFAQLLQIVAGNPTLPPQQLADLSAASVGRRYPVSRPRHHAGLVSGQLVQTE